MYKLVAFDLDGTLADSKRTITPEMAKLLHSLSKITTVAVISGGSFARFEDQILRNLIPSENIILLPAEGSERFEYKNKKWELTDKRPFDPELKKKVVEVLKEIIADPKFEIPPFPEGEYIEDRDTEIAFSALGQNAKLAEKEKWDPDKSRRLKIKKAIEAKIPNVMVAVAGTTSIDILPLGFDKATGLTLLLASLGLQPEDMVFVGDAIVPGGNDYPVFAAGMKSIPVSGAIETAEVIEKMIQEANGPVPAEGPHPIPEFPKNAIAYFCSEYAFEINPSMYAGGLGILAGDYVLQAAEMNFPFIAIGLRYGEVIPTGFGELEDVKVEVPIKNGKIQAKVWHRAFAPNVHALLLDAGEVTTNLYDNDFYKRIQEQMVLGIGGVRLLKQLGIVPRVYHLNEGHTSFAAVGLMVEGGNEYKKIVSTKHTILSAAGLQISFNDLKEFIGPYCEEFNVPFETVFEKGKFELSSGFFSTTKMIVESAVKKNAVSALHAVFEKKVHPHSTLVSITNGVYRKRWQARELQAHVQDEDLRKIKRKLRLDLFSYIETTAGKRFNPDVCTLVWARRMAGYKQPYLLFSDLQRLTSIITNAKHPLQVVISGKAHPGDAQGQEIVRKITEFSNNPLVKGKVVYLPDYSISSAEKLTRGADIWLNTPELGKEACGTSGMKASLNGAVQVSVRDGWVDEISLDGVGWALPAENTAETLYDLLEHEILPCYYDESEKWTSRMRGTMDIVEKNYTADRMLKDYEKKLYTW